MAANVKPALPDGFELETAAPGLPEGFELEPAEKPRAFYEPARDSVWEQGKRFLNDPSAYLSERRAAIDALPGLLKQNEDNNVHPDPIETRNWAENAIVASMSGGRGMLTARTAPAAAGSGVGEWGMAVPDVISSAGHNSPISAVANREGLLQAAKTVGSGAVDVAKKVAPYVDRGSLLYFLWKNANKKH